MVEAEVDRYAAELMVLAACEAYRVKPGEMGARYWRRQPARRKRREAIAKARKMRDDRGGPLWAISREMGGQYIRWLQDLEGALLDLRPMTTEDYMRWMEVTAERVPYADLGPQVTLSFTVDGDE